MRAIRLITAEILYRLPDYPGLLQSFVWQQHDLPPEFPVLHRFPTFWERNIEGRLFSVRVGSRSLIAPRETRFIHASLALH